MKKFIFLLIAVLSLSTKGRCMDSRYLQQDGTMVRIASWTVKGQPVFNQAEADRVILASQAFGSATLTMGDFISTGPAKYELAVATMVLGGLMDGKHQISGIDAREFLSLCNDKAAIADRAYDINTEKLSSVDMQGSYPQFNFNPKINKARRQVDVLVNQYLTLP